MQCLRPIKVYNNSHTLSLSSPTKMINYVPCGKCANCQINYKNQYMMRVNYETEKTIKNGGYILFDTLTYDENNVPWAKDIIKKEFGYEIEDKYNFRTFYYKDFTDFWKRVNKELKTRYGKYNNTKYIVVGEYGTKENRTHRSHYHIIVFVNNKDIEPSDLSHIIKSKWKYGITDGIDDKGEYYFNTRRIFKDKIEAVQNATGYIAKYINKDNKYSHKVKKMTSIIISKIKQYKGFNDLSYLSSYYFKLHLQELRRYLNQFQKHSKGFGYIPFYENDLNLLVDDGKMLFKDKYVIKRKITIPQYYYRKYFQAYDKEKKQWRYTSLGMEYKLKSLKRISKSMEIGLNNRLNTFYNLRIDENDYPRDKYKRFIKISDETIIEQIKKYLGKRTIKDYVEYTLYYKDRLINGDYYDRYNFEKNIFIKKDDILCKTTTRDYFENGERIIYYDSGALTFGKFLENNTINENSVKKFENFDKIGILFEILNFKINIYRQRGYEQKLELRKKFEKNEKLFAY